LRAETTTWPQQQPAYSASGCLQRPGSIDVRQLSIWEILSRFLPSGIPQEEVRRPTFIFSSGWVHRMLIYCIYHAMSLRRRMLQLAILAICLSLLYIADRLASCALPSTFSRRYGQAKEDNDQKGMIRLHERKTTVRDYRLSLGLA
jgi:hypothetical protein